MKNRFMSRAIELSIESVKSGGGPFGSVIIKNNEIISEGMNRVTKNNDPTAHGEIVAIRNACKNLNDFSLKGCELYTSCEPCPMCLSAIYWSRIDKIYYANTRDDAKKIKERKIPTTQLMRDEALQGFKLWKNTENKVKY